jgi:hypothetical protein
MAYFNLSYKMCKLMIKFFIIRFLDITIHITSVAIDRILLILIYIKISNFNYSIYCHISNKFIMLLNNSVDVT